MLDLIIHGGEVITPIGVARHDIGVTGEIITAVAGPGALAGVEAARRIDANGKIVMPGGIDPHVHCKWFLPNPDGSAALTDPPDVVGRAAVHGGTTTMIDFTRASQVPSLISSSMAARALGLTLTWMIFIASNPCIRRTIASFPVYAPPRRVSRMRLRSRLSFGHCSSRS